jgi:hypothetical protein
MRTAITRPKGVRSNLVTTGAMRNANKIAIASGISTAWQKYRAATVAKTVGIKPSRMPALFGDSSAMRSLSACGIDGDFQHPAADVLRSLRHGGAVEAK